MSNSNDERYIDACRNGVLSEVKRLLATGAANVNAQFCHYQTTPLIIASQSGHRDVVQILLDSGADINQADSYRCVFRTFVFRGQKFSLLIVFSQTAVYCAAVSNCDLVVDLLALRGADVSLKTSHGFVRIVKKSVILFNIFCRWTPLIVAAREGHASVIETMVVYGAEIDALTIGRSTSLMNAVQSGHIDVVRLLLSLNADTTKVNDDGKAALQYAKTKADVRQLLLDQGKKSVKNLFVCFVLLKEFVLA